MIQSILIVVAAAALYGIFKVVSGLRHNIAEAKRSGFPYIVLPCNPFWMPWRIGHPLILPLFKLLPKTTRDDWIKLLVPDGLFKTRLEFTQRFGSNFWLVSPGELQLIAGEASTISYLTLRRDQFPKWLEMYGLLQQFGENVNTAEGAVWRMHRKATATSFNERNTALIFYESVRQARATVDHWTGPDQDQTKPIDTLGEASLKLALHIISYVGFGFKILWPGEAPTEDIDPRLLKYGSNQPMPGHTLSFGNALSTMLDNLLLLMLAPKWLLKVLPSKMAKDTLESHGEYAKYMDELLDEKIDDAQEGYHGGEGMDLMGQMARTSYGPDAEKGGSQGGVLSRQEILANAFIMLLAGHETTARTLQFTLLNLATNPSSQRHLQEDIDQVVGDADPKTWKFEDVVPKFLGGMVGAAMNETLRQMPPVLDIPKMVPRTHDEELIVDGQKHRLPKGARIMLSAAAVHLSARYWPTRPSKVDPTQETDVLDWVPERWLDGYDSRRESEKTGNVAGVRSKEEETEDYGGPEGPDTSAQLFRPERGSFIPFSDGSRACLGRRTAQVEMLAATAVIFKNHSIELAVDEWASPEEVKKMTKEEKRAVYKKAQDSCRWKMDQSISRITLQLRPGHDVPIRVVKRGEEQFTSWLD